MTVFNLPDLGEGLPDAEIHQWYVAEGEEVKVDQPLVSMETAKAVVDVPSPFSGTIVKLHGNTGTVILTGEPLVTFKLAAGESAPIQADHHEAEQTQNNAAVQTKSATSSVKAIPAVRALAQKLGVNLETITGTGPNGTITIDDVNQATGTKATATEGEALHGVRRIMAQQMAKSHAEVVAVTLSEDANLSHWPEKVDTSVRLLRAIVAACKAEPILNAHFFGQGPSIKMLNEVNIGIAVDTAAGLYVPVIKDVAQQSDASLRASLNMFKEKARAQNFSPEDLKNPSITLSNFGTISGRYSSPIVVPPMVAIIGVGKTRPTVVAVDGKMVIQSIMPISLTFDHRAATGGEAARFLAAFIKALEQA